MLDFLLALHYLCSMFVILVLKATLYIMSCFSARKTTCRCRMISAVCYLCTSDPRRVMHTRTLPLRGDIQSWPQGKKKSQLLGYVLIAMCLCNFDQLAGLPESKSDIFYLERLSVFWSQLSGVNLAQILILIFATDISDVRLLTPAPFPENSVT